MKDQVKHMQDEPDIGSGEKNPGQVDTEKMIEQVGKTQKTGQPPSRQENSGSSTNPTGQ